MHTISDKKLLMLRPEELRIPQGLPRKCFDMYELRLLANSIAVSGIVEPLSVRKNEDGKFELIAGQRRLKAAVMAGMRRVPCVLHKIDSTSAALYSVMVNLQRSNLGFMDEAYAIDRLITRYGLSRSEVSTRLGIAPSALGDKLKLLGLAEDIKIRLTASGVAEQQAMALLKLPSHKHSQALDGIIGLGLNTAQTKDYIAEILNPKKETAKTQPAPPPCRKSAIGDVRLFSNSLSKLVDTLQRSGIDARSRKYENDKYIEYKIRIRKEFSENNNAEQLKIC